MLDADHQANLMDLARLANSARICCGVLPLKGCWGVKRERDVALKVNTIEAKTAP
jgi:hypothetical protein